MQGLAVDGLNVKCDMADALTESPTILAYTPPAEDVERAIRYGRAARSQRTRDEYARDWAQFERYCADAGLGVLPARPQTVAAYLSSLAASGLSVATIRRRAAAIGCMHRDAEMTAPTAHRAVELVLSGIARTHGAAALNRKSAITIEQLEKMVSAIGDADLRAIRDKAILLVQFAGALRRSELAALDVSDIRFTDQGMRLLIRSSKTDQEKKGAEIGVPLARLPEVCAVRALRAWLSNSGLANGPVFRSFALPRGRKVKPALQSNRLNGGDIARIIKLTAAAAGLKSESFSGHSPRAGFITATARAGASEASIQRVSRHVSTAVLRSYIRHATLFEDAPLNKL